MAELLLLSNSRAPGQAFLEHAADAIRSILGDRARILFVPFASGRRAILAGASTGRLFRRGVPPANVPAGTDLPFLLDTTPRFDTSPWSCEP